MVSELNELISPSKWRGVIFRLDTDLWLDLDIIHQGVNNVIINFQKTHLNI